MRIAIVEDEPNELRSLRRAIGTWAGFQCVGAWATAETALDQIPRLRPDVVIVDLNLPRMQGVRLIWELKRIHPKCEILVHTIESNPTRVFEALKAGAVGYLVKGATPAEIREAVRDAVTDGSRMTPTIARLVLRWVQAGPGTLAGGVELSQRQSEVLQLIVRGYTDKAVAHELGLGVNTVKTHIRRIYEVLQVHSRAQVIAWWHAQKRG